MIYELKQHLSFHNNCHVNIYICLWLNEMYYIQQAFDGIGSRVCVRATTKVQNIPHMIKSVWGHIKGLFC